MDDIFPPLQETLRCLKGSAAVFWPLLPQPFLPGSWPCLAIKLLQLPESSLAIWFFYRVSKLLDGIFPPLQETLTCLKSSAAALGHSCGARFFQVPGHAFRLSRSSFQNLPFAGQVSCQMVFLSRFDSGRWHLFSFARSAWIPERHRCSFRPLLLWL